VTVRAEARAAALKLLAHCRAQDWAGHDPYDALNSPLLSALPLLDVKPLRLLLTQALRRSPIDVRGLARVPRTQNPKALALGLAAVLELGRAGVQGDDDLAGDLIERLIALRSPGARAWCWGYNFPWQTRTVLVPRGAPNLVCTSFVGGALLDAYAERGDPRCLRMARSAAEWMLEDLAWTDGHGVTGFAYPVASSRARIHNADLLGAHFLCRVSRITGEERFLAPALSAARGAVAAQDADGSWPYGQGRGQRWIDNVHTGYNLCALHGIAREAATAEFDACTRRGLRFYRAHFFRPDGAPGYFHDRTYPIDIHCVAQSLITLRTLRAVDGASARLAAAVFRWAMDHMWDARGFFYYRVLRLGTVRTSYMRWAQAWMLLALATLVEDEGAAPVDAPPGGSRNRAHPPSRSAP
jgi:hypothetical protein